MAVVAVGGQGSVGDGADFVAATGLTTPSVVMDTSFRVWSHYDVLGMPTAVLLTASGDHIETFDGRFSAQDVLSRL